MHTDEIRDDLAYVKALAEEGRDTPLVGGFYYALWGGLVGLAALIDFSIDISGYKAPPLVQFAPFVSVFVIGWVVSIWHGKTIGAKPGATTLGNRTAGAAWTAVGIFITAIWFTLFFVHDNYTQTGVRPYFLFNLMFPLSLGVYGIAFYATAAAARIDWLKGVALLAILFSVSSLFLLGSVWQTLHGGLATLAVAFVPGILLMRKEPSEIV